MFGQIQGFIVHTLVLVSHTQHQSVITQDTRPISRQASGIQASVVFLIERRLEILQPQLISPAGQDITLGFPAVTVKQYFRQDILEIAVCTTFILLIPVVGKIIGNRRLYSPDIMVAGKIEREVDTRLGLQQGTSYGCRLCHFLILVVGHPGYIECFTAIIGSDIDDRKPTFIGK